jgi:hypothetical protein
MEATTEKSPADLMQEFYSKKFYVSYSGLSKMLYSPSLFYRHYILKQREERLDSHLIDGKVIHCLLLDDGSFDKLFMILPSSLPTGNTRLIVDRIYDRVKDGPGLFENYTEEILEVLKEINLHQSLKTDKQRLEKIITEESKTYFEFLKNKENRDIIDGETLRRCNEAVDALRNNSVVSNLMGLIKHEMENIDIFNEIEIKTELDNYPFGIKGVLDNIKVDYDNKTVYINDLKTTGKTILEFPESVEYFNYWAQSALYLRLIRDSFKDLLTEDWNIIFHFIVIDKYNQVYPFRVSLDSMAQWQEKLDTKLNEFNWHYTEKKYALPYKFATHEVLL